MVNDTLCWAAALQPRHATEARINAVRSIEEKTEDACSYKENRQRAEAREELEPELWSNKPAGAASPLHLP